MEYYTTRELLRKTSKSTP